MPVSPADVARFTGLTIPWPIITYAGIYTPRRGKPKLIAYGGLVWRFTMPDGRPRCDIWFDVADHKLMARLNRGLTLVRWARRMVRLARQMGEAAVFCVRDDDPNSAKLLGLAGLELGENVTLEFEGGAKRTGEIWFARLV